MLSNNNNKNGVCPYVAPNFIIEENKEIKYDEVGNIKAIVDKTKYENVLKQQEKNEFVYIFLKALKWAIMFFAAVAVVYLLLRLL
jgi:hypothetical protein